MSAIAFATQDALGAAPSPARKVYAEAQNRDAGTNFDAALADSATDSAPSPKAASNLRAEADSRAAPTPHAASSSGVAAKKAFWRELAAYSDSGKNALRAPPEKADRRGADQTPADEAPETQSGDAPPPPGGSALAPGLPRPATETTKGATETGRNNPTKGSTNPALGRPSSALASTPLVKMSDPPKVFFATEKNSAAAKKEIFGSAAGLALGPSARGTTVKIKAPVHATHADPLLAALIAASILPSKSPAPPAEPAVSARAAAPCQASAPPRVTAALAVSAPRVLLPNGVEKTRGQKEIALASAGEETKTAVHVVALKSWLQPVSPIFNPGLKSVAAADHAAAAKPRPAASVAEQLAKASASAAAPAAAAPRNANPSSSPFAGVAGFASAQAAPGGGASSAPPNAAPTASSAAPQVPAAPALAPAPRRDLEIAMAPAGLGGLAVRMKSAGDRLEISFVADKGETARMISDKSAALESQLRDAGIGLGGININAAAKHVAASAASGQGGATAHFSGDGPRGQAHSTPHGQNFAGGGRQDQSHDTSENSGRDSRAPSGDRGLYI